MCAYTWRMWHINTAKYYETQIFGKQEGVHCSPSTAHNGVSRCLPYSLIKCLPCPRYSGMGCVA